MSDYRDYTRGRIEITPTGDIKAPKNIVTSVPVARAIHERYRADHIYRIDFYAQIKGVISGNPPYDPEVMQQNGLGHAANFNNLDANSIFKRACLAYWSLLNSAESLINFKLDLPQPDAPIWARIMGLEWTKVVRKWQGLNVHMGTLSSQLVMFGLSPVLWPDERDWRWETIELQRFFVADQAPTDVSKLTSICVESVFTLAYLYEIYTEFKGREKETEWNLESIAKLLLRIANNHAKQENNQISDMMEFQKRLENGDLSHGLLFTDSVRLVTLFQKEYDGQISHYIFDRYTDHTEFLFFKDRQYKSFDEAVVIFTYSNGEFTLHGNKGVGHVIFSGSQAMMQMDCDIVNMARLSSTPLVKTSATGPRQLDQIKIYPGIINNIGQSEFVQNNLGANISQLIGASQFFYQKINYNTANSGDDPGSADRNQGSVSDSQARRQSYKEFSVLRDNIAHFYFHADFVYRNMTQKMLASKEGYPGYDEVKEWKDKCIKKGVPEEVFDTIFKKGKLTNEIEVYATRVAGDGSTLALLSAIESFIGLTGGNVGAKAAKNLRRMAIIGSFGADHLEELDPSGDDSDETSGGASLAGLENNSMVDGKSPVFSPDNEHRSHLATHIALGTHTIQLIQQGQTSPIEADKVLAILVPHMQEHIQMLARDPFARAFLEQIKGPFGQINQFATLNHKNAAKMIQGELEKRKQLEQQQGEQMSEQKLAEQELMMEQGRKDRESEAKLERNKQQSEERGQIMREKIQTDASNQRLKIQLESSNKKLENTSTEELQGKLASMNQSTPAPYDIEPPTSTS